MMQLLRGVLICFLLAGGLAAAPPDTLADPREAYWDTVAAELQLIEAAAVSDTVRAQMARTLFARYDRTAADYRAFRAALLARPEEEQRRFLQRVKKIIDARMPSRRLSPPNRSPDR